MRNALHYILLTLLTATVAAGLTGCGASRNASKKRPTVTTRTEPSGKKRPEIPSFSTPEEAKEALVAIARDWLGVPYVWGGDSREGADCSGFLTQVFSEGAGVKIPRTTVDQHKYCVPVDRDHLEVGDILFFSSRKSGGAISHVGMYTGGNKMIHASSSRGVVEDDLSWKYYTDHYVAAGRVPQIAESLPKKPTVIPEPSPVATATISATTNWKTDISQAPSVVQPKPEPMQVAQDSIARTPDQVVRDAFRRAF